MTNRQRDQDPARAPRRRARLALERLQPLWCRVPAGRSEVLALWLVGLPLGGGALWLLDGLPIWATASALTLLLGGALWFALTAAPLLVPTQHPATPSPAPQVPPTQAPVPPARPRVPPLLDLVPLAGGEFGMGSRAATDAELRPWAADYVAAFGGDLEQRIKDWRRWQQQEQPRHRVRVAPLRIARVPVTRGQWRAVLSKAPEEWSAAGDDADLPATHVTWADALAFCNALSVREHLTPCYAQGADGDWTWDRTADGYRLPTEAEWEYACRAGQDGWWFWGDDPKGADAHAWYRGNSSMQPHPVGRKQPNGFGLHDMASLVWEWCWDRFGPYQDSETPADNPTGAVDGDGRVVRGGSFDDPPEILRSARRGFARPEARNFYLGLRCVRAGARQQL